MSGGEGSPAGPHSGHGQVVYLQLPTLDVAVSAVFYEAVFGWSVDSDRGRFEAPGIIGEWTTDRPPTGDAGPVVWILAEQLSPVLQRIDANGGKVRGRPEPDGGERYLVECDDPAGNRIGVAVPIRRRTESQTLVAVRDVEASSRWYQHLLGLRSDHGGPTYERLVDGNTLVVQLHSFVTDHHHASIGDPEQELGNGVALWFGETADFDGAVERAAELGATVVHPPLRNPSEGEGNGPGHREIWIKDPDGYTIVVASPDGEAFEPSSASAQAPCDDPEVIVPLAKDPVVSSDHSGPAAEAPSVFRPGGVSYLHIPCREPSRAADFYQAVFGWDPRRDSDEPAFADATGHVIGHFVVGEAALGDTGVRPFVYVDDIDQTVALIESAGGSMSGPVRPEGTLLVGLFSDPEGNLIGIWTETAKNDES